jgi:hypothetical protein
VLLATIPLSLSGGVADRPGMTYSERSGDWFSIGIVAAFTLSGAALIHLRPRNVIGWLLLACGLLQAVQTSCEAYGARALTDPDGSLPFGLLAMWVATWTWEPALLLPVLVLPALYPSGKPPSRFWRWHVRISLVGIVVLIVTAATNQVAMDDTVRDARLPWDAPTWWVWASGLLTAAIIVPATAVSLVGTVVRATRARGPERAQLVWLVCVVGAMVATVFLPVEYLFGIAYALVPIAVVIGVLRYRLLGIEVAVRRTLLYAPLTLLVALTVGGLTTVLARLVPGGAAAFGDRLGGRCGARVPGGDPAASTCRPIRPRRAGRPPRRCRPGRRRPGDRLGRPGAVDAGGRRCVSGIVVRGRARRTRTTGLVRR